MTTEIHTDSKFRGWVVMYPNDQKFKGLDEYLLVKDWRAQKAVCTHSLSECTIFDNRELAEKWMYEHPQLAGEHHRLPEVLAVWCIASFTVTNPNREK